MIGNSFPLTTATDEKEEKHGPTFISVNRPGALQQKHVDELRFVQISVPSFSFPFSFSLSVFDLCFIRG